MPSSPDSSSDSSVGSPHNQYDGPNLEAESALPGVVSRPVSFVLQELFPPILGMSSLFENTWKVNGYMALDGTVFFWLKQFH